MYVNNSLGVFLKKSRSKAKDGEKKKEKKAKVVNNNGQAWGNAFFKSSYQLEGFYEEQDISIWIYIWVKGMQKRGF